VAFPQRQGEAARRRGDGAVARRRRGGVAAARRRRGGAAAQVHRVAPNFS